MTVTSEKGIIEDGMNIMALECQSILSGENQREIFYRIFGCFVQNANFDNKADIKQVFDLVNAST